MRELLSWKSKKFKLGQVDPMRKSLKLGSCGTDNNYLKGALPFRGKGEENWSGGENCNFTKFSRLFSLWILVHSMLL